MAILRGFPPSTLMGSYYPVWREMSYKICKRCHRCNTSEVCEDCVREIEMICDGSIWLEEIPNNQHRYL